MTLRSALQDVKETTLAAIAGLLGKLAYLGSLRHGRGNYDHWGMQAVYGNEASERALRQAHAEVVSGVLRTALPALEEDLQKSSENSGFSAHDYIENLRDHLTDLVPGERKDTPAASHLNSVLVALSSLEKNRERATRSTS